MKASAMLALGLIVAGCEAQAPTPSDVATGEAEGLPPVPAETLPQPPEAASPESTGSILQPLSRADWTDRLESGAGCNLSRDGRDYVVIVLGDGVAKVGGAVVDLTGVPNEFNGLTEPATYRGGEAAIRVTLAPDLGEGDTVDETFTRPVRVEVASAGRTQRFEASWTCGS